MGNNNAKTAKFICPICGNVTDIRDYLKLFNNETQMETINMLSDQVKETLSDVYLELDENGNLIGGIYQNDI